MVVIVVRAIELVEHSQEHGPGLYVASSGLRIRGQVVGLGEVPQLVERVDHQLGVLAGRIAEVQLTVAGESGVGEVGRSGEHGRVERVDHDERLAAQELVGEAAHLDGGGGVVDGTAKPVDESPGRVVGFDRESGQVAVVDEPERCRRATAAAPGGSAAFLAPAPRRRRTLGACSIFIGDQPESTRIQIRGRQRQLRW